MSENVETTAAPTAASEAKPPAGSRELAEFHAKRATAARLEEVKAAADGMEAAKAGDAPAEDAKADGPRERGKDGKFKKGQKAEAKPKDDTSTPAGDEQEAPAVEAESTQASDPGAAGAGIGRARKLVKEGNIAAALELIGLHPEKLEGKQWGAFRQREKAAADAERKAAEKEQGLANIARQLQQQYGAYDDARKAYEAEDYDTAFKLWTGETPDDFTRKRVHAMHTKTKDPEVLKLRKELEALRQEKQTEAERMAQARQQQERAQARETYQKTLASELAEMDDPRFVRVAQKPAFIKRVFDIQEQHWNERTQETIDTVEAAELAWEELYEGVAGETSGTTAQSVSKATGPSQKPVRQGAKASTTLNPHEASEASPAHKLKPGSPELRAFYARRAELALLGQVPEQEAG